MTILSKGFRNAHKNRGVAAVENHLGKTKGLKINQAAGGGKSKKSQRHRRKNSPGVSPRKRRQQCRSNPREGKEGP